MSTRLFQPSMAGGEISPSLFGRVDIDKYSVSLRRCRNFIIHRTGGTSNRAGSEFLGEVLDSAYSPKLIEFRFNNTTQVCLLEFGEYTMRMWYQGALIVDDTGNPVVIETPYSAEEAHHMEHAQSGDVLYFTHIDHAPQKLARYSWTDWRFTELTFLPTIDTVGLSITCSGDILVSGGDKIAYVSTVVDPDTGEESLSFGWYQVEGPASTNWNVNQRVIITINGAKVYNHYRIYKSIGSNIWGYIGEIVSDPNTGNYFIDRNITPDVSRAPPRGYNPFRQDGDYPAVVSLHQQRLVFGRTKNKPNGLWFSKVGFYENMSRSTPPRDDDPIDVVIGSGEVNEIRGLVSVRDLVVLTSGSENVVNGGSTGSVITPQTVSIQPQSYWGSGLIPPLLSGNSVLFLQGIGSAVRDLVYDYSVDGFSGNDRSILARHLVEGFEIVSWDYAQTPESTVWMVRGDGKLLGLSYFREQEIGAWFLCDTDGLYEDICTIEGQDRDEVFVVVNREVNGETRRYIERFASRSVKTLAEARFLDSYIHYFGKPRHEFDGLDHLEGKTVQALADGSPTKPVVVQGGIVRLERMASNVTIGLPYDNRAYIATLDVDLGLMQGVGSVTGRKKSVPTVNLKVEKSREFLAGSWREAMDAREDIADIIPKMTLVKTTPITWGDPINLSTGTMGIKVSSDWNKTGSVVLSPAGPVPLTILSIAPDIEIGTVS